MTVDLVGSTAYKATPMDEAKASEDPRPEWVLRFRQFYQQFPEILEAQFRETDFARDANHDADSLRPKIWKTIGDEILFCCRVVSVHHLACCVTAFLKTLDAYGRNLDADRVPLDVKGAGWIAAFPAENISIEIFGGSRAASVTTDNDDVLTEKFEAAADAEPHKYDFLGKGIDAGFRVAKNASSDRFTASLELGYILADATDHSFFSGRFSYHGREALKGVNGGRPYPVISIDAERNQSKRLLRTRERILTQEPEVTAVALKDFLHAYMENDGIELPSLPSDTNSDAEPPKSYLQFKTAWHSNVKEMQKRDDGVEASEREDNQKGTIDIPKLLLSDLEKFLKNDKPSKKDD